MAFSYFEDFIVHSTAKSTIFELITSFSVVGEILFGIFSQSNTLSTYLINNSQKIFWLIENETLSKNKTRCEFYKEAASLILKTDNFDKRDYYLRQYRKNEYLRIAVREIIQACSFEDTMKELSWLAEALVDVALECSKDRLQGRYGYKKNGFSVIGMGKLGNEELNFSSDIDLLFVHDKESDSEYYNRLARTLISTLNDNKEGGFVYRVDMRLRPGGKTAALSLTVGEYEDYYSTFGQMWEKMSLAKAYPVAGNVELGFEFLKTVKPFVYKKSLDMEYISEIRSLMFKIKKYSDKNLNSKFIPYDRLDVKKGVGGIREVEFIVNYFQLIYGGRDRDLEHVSTLKGLEILSIKKYMDKSDARFLKDAYLFLRRIEHKIQLLNEQQTQNLPVDYKSLKKLAKKLSMSFDEFLDRYKETTDKVHRIFNSIFIRDYKIPVLGALDDIEGFLREHKIDNVESVSVFIKDAVKKFLAEDVKRKKIEEIFDYTFNNVKKELFGECVKGFSFINPAYLVLIFENKSLFNVLLKMLSIGLGEQLGKNQELFEYFISPDEFDISSFDKYGFEKVKLMEIFGLLKDVYNHKYNIFNNFTVGFVNSVVGGYDIEKKLCVIGYGKLATGELFIGSDLDLIFVSSEDSYSYITIAQKAVKQLKSLYDVDLRLRPYGDRSPIVSDVDYLASYFRKSAWTWEKQAAQKSRIIYSGFDKGRVEEIYKEFVTSNPPKRKDILDMKKKIEKYKGGGFNIKSFDGGINDIEFLSQSVCFENGCIEVGLSCLELLDKIKQLHLNIDVDMLSRAYIFYRTILNMNRLFSNSSVINDFDTLEFLMGENGLKEKIEKFRVLVRSEFKRWFEE